MDPWWTWPCRDATPAPPSRFRASFCGLLELSGRLFRAEPARPDTRHISAVRRVERSVCGRAGIHITFHLRLGRRDRRRGRSLFGCWGRRVRGRRSHQSRGHDRHTDRCIGRNRRNYHRHRRWSDRRWRVQSSFCVGHRRHRRRQPVEPQQYTAEGNYQHRPIDRKPHPLCPSE